MSERHEAAQENLDILAQNPYPGRGIVMGLNKVGDTALQAYWVMGRSENSRNRILVEEEGIVRTKPHDPSKVTDPSLIIYNAMQTFERRWHVVSNGDQTDTIIDGFKERRSLEDSIKTRSYEPDEPNYTPRISGVLTSYVMRPPATGSGFAELEFSVIRKPSSSEEPEYEFFQSAAVNPADRGLGSCIHTYDGDGSPLPSISRSPYDVPVGDGLEDTAEMLWHSLDEDNRVAIAVKAISLRTGVISHHIINALETV